MQTHEVILINYLTFFFSFFYTIMLNMKQTRYSKCLFTDVI